MFLKFIHVGSVPGSGRSTGEGIGYPLQDSWAFLVAQLVQNPPALWETWVQSLGWGDPLEERKATHSSILAWRIGIGTNTLGQSHHRKTIHGRNIFVSFLVFQKFPSSLAVLGQGAKGLG